MSRIKLSLQVAGVTLAGIGVCCLPLGVSFNPDHPKQDMSMFIHMADLGFFVKAALILIPLGLILLGIGYVLPRSDSDEDVLL